MKAMILEAPGGLDRIKRVEIPQPGMPAANEILMRVRASSLNYHDFGVAAGMAPVNDGRILLTDGAGIVEAVGSDVSTFEPGDRVVGCNFPQWQFGGPQVSDFSQTPGDGVDGFAREFVTAPAQGFTHAPEGYSIVEAAALPTAAVTAWRALMVNGPLKPGETVLVQGSGGVSIFALQIAKAAGANVIATSSSDQKLARLRELGADYLINYREQAQWGQVAFGITDGKGVDHVVDVGGPATLPQSVDAVRVGGHIALIGILGGMQAPLPMLGVLAKQIRLQGCLNGSVQDQKDLIRFLETRRIKPVLDRSFPLEDLAAAFRYEASGGHFGKIMITI